MPRIKIKSFNDKVATAGLHLGGDPAVRRKLEPGEVIEVDEGFAADACATGKVELTMDPITRPLDYPNYKIGNLCSPSYEPVRATDEVEQAEALAWQEELVKTLNGPEPEPKAKPKKAKPVGRAARRARVEAAQSGEKAQS